MPAWLVPGLKSAWLRMVLGGQQHEFEGHKPTANWTRKQQPIVKGLKYANAIVSLGAQDACTAPVATSRALIGMSLRLRRRSCRHVSLLHPCWHGRWHRYKGAAAKANMNKQATDWSSFTELWVCFKGQRPYFQLLCQHRGSEANKHNDLSLTSPNFLLTAQALVSQAVLLMLPMCCCKDMLESDQRLEVRTSCGWNGLNAQVSTSLLNVVAYLLRN